MVSSTAVFLSSQPVTSMLAILLSQVLTLSASAYLHVAADYTPACYTDFGSLVTLSAPGGDLEYYGKIGEAGG